MNLSMVEEEQFHVAYRDVVYSDFDAFIQAIVGTGHQIEMDVSVEVSDFLHLMVHQADDMYREVQTEMRLQTGYFAENGTE